MPLKTPNILPNPENISLEDPKPDLKIKIPDISWNGNPIGQSVVYALINALASAIFSISFAALIVRNGAPEYFTYCLATILYGIILNSLIISLFSSYKGMMVEVNEVGIALFLPIIFTLTKNIGANTSADVFYGTVMASMFVTCLLSGLMYSLVGFFKITKFIRFIPYSVVGGFISGSGMLLIVGAFELITGPVHVEGGLEWADRINLFAPWVIFGVGLYYLMEKLKKFQLLPLSIFAAVILFYGYYYFSYGDILSALDSSYLIGNEVQGELWHFPSPTLAAKADWGLVLRQWPSIVSIAIFTTAALLFNCAGIERSTKKTLNLNRELVVAGAGNVASSFLFSMPSFQILSSTILCHKLKTASRMTGIVSAGAMLAFLVFAGPAIPFVPKGVLGGVVIYISLECLHEWLFVSYRRLPPEEYLIVLGITVTVIFLGMLVGIAVGMVCSILIFVFKYSRISCIRTELDGETAKSNIIRSDVERDYLRKQKNDLHVIILQGFIFFGTSETVYDRVHATVNTPGLPSPKFVVLDMSLVNNIEMTAVAMIEKIITLAEKVGFSLFLVECNPRIRKQISGSLTEIRLGDKVYWENSLEKAVEQFEESTLAHSGIKINKEMKIMDLFKKITDSSPEKIERLFNCFTKVEFRNDEPLIRQGEEKTGLIYIETGAVNVFINSNEGKRKILLGKLLAGAIVGEISLYMATKRTADVISVGKTVAYSLTSEALANLEKNDPEVAILFHRFIAIEMGRRIINSNEAIRALRH